MTWKRYSILRTYGLKVLYDAAHAFGVNYKGSSVLRHGDLSSMSFHATKVFNTFEGGAIVCPDSKLKQRVDYLKNFGFADEVTVTAPGINGKMNEFQAALGLAQLKHISSVIERRRMIAEAYRGRLRGVRGIGLLPEMAEVTPNYSYFPIFVKDEFPISRDALYEAFRAKGIYVRRYFYPLISTMPMYRHLLHRFRQLPESSYCEPVLCLPIYPDLMLRIWKDH